MGLLSTFLVIAVIGSILGYSFPTIILLGIFAGVYLIARMNLAQLETMEKLENRNENINERLRQMSTEQIIEELGLNRDQA